MKIDRDKLVELLAEKTGLERDAVESQLKELIERIISTAEKGKALEVKEFGMFYLSKDNELTFRPSGDLSTEVNYKYAGMEPVVIKETELTGEQEPAADPAEESEAEHKEESGERPAEGAGMKPGQDSGAESEPSDPFQIDESSADEPFPEMKPEEVPIPEGAAREESPIRNTKNPVTTLITTIVTILVLIVGVIIAIDLGYLDQIFGGDEDEEITMAEPRQPDPVVPDEPTPDPAEPEQAEVIDESAGEQPDPAAIEEDETDLPEEAGVGEPAEEETAEMETEEAVPVVEEETEIAPYGLHGESRQIDGTYYSIVLHALGSEARAEQLRLVLEDEGYRVVVAPIEHEEHGRLWRVGVGQFQTISAAMQAAEELPEDFRENHFIGRIQ